MSRSAPLVAVLCCVSLASCGGDDEQRPAKTGATTPATAPEAANTPAPVSTGPVETSPPATNTAESDPATQAADGCGPAAGLEVAVAQGDVSCAEARAAVAGYDPTGPKVQQVGAFACESAEAAVRPLVLTCVSEAGEVVASTPAG